MSLHPIYGPLTPEEFKTALAGPYGELDRIAREKGVRLSNLPPDPDRKKSYTVRVTFTGVHEFEVEAESECEAKAIAREEADDWSVDDWEIDEIEIEEID